MIKFNENYFLHMRVSLYDITDTGSIAFPQHPLEKFEGKLFHTTSN